MRFDWSRPPTGFHGRVEVVGLGGQVVDNGCQDIGGKEVRELQREQACPKHFMSNQNQSRKRRGPPRLTDQLIHFGFSSQRQQVKAHGFSRNRGRFCPKQS
jgi:hypothetical protein